MTDGKTLYDAIYNADAVRARVGHLPRAMREYIERVVRTLRDETPAGGMIAPVPSVTSIMLVDRHARRCWSGSDERDEVPTFEFWVIVSDRLLTHRKLWQAAEARIAEAVAGRCVVRLSFLSAAGLKAGWRRGDEFICERLAACIALYRAKRDDPRARRGTGRGIWLRALARFEAADDAFQPACLAFREAERAYFALRVGRDTALSDEEDGALHAQAGLDAAMADEQRLGAERHEAVMALLHTPAPDLAAIARKLELVRDEGDGDDHAVVSILADIRWIAERIAACGRPS